MKYEELDKHFKCPKWLLEGKHFSVKRLPRKEKKQLNKTIYNIDLTTTVWYNLETNYKRFLIKKIVEKYETNSKRE